ncbi:Alpha/beta hydrolase domain-containing protein 17C [Aphelenchoides bicaudatus]|nr:Alpha/beta hydrolase domain-containing protein 17C [Aphelenchoides bicaudatus]
MEPSRMPPNGEVAVMSTQQNPNQSRVSFRDLCALFCCPPFPSAIVSKLAFMPPNPSYRIDYDPETKEPKVHLLEHRAEFPHGDEEFRNVEVFFTRTRRNNKIACMFVRPCGPNARFTIIFSHGNAVGKYLKISLSPVTASVLDLGQMCSFYYGLGYRLGVNVFSYDYSGYGCSSGRPSEKNLYADIAAALAALKSRYNIRDDQVILYGQSIALILHSPLLSGLRVACAGVQRTWCCDAFPSIDKIPQVQCPTLVIHGTDDDVIDFSHGLTLYENCPSSVEPLWVAGAGHNDVEMSSVYLDRLRAFIENEAGVPRSRSTVPVQ